MCLVIVYTNLFNNTNTYDIMDITLIIYIVIVIALIVLAFKFIKKILFAVITSVIIVLLSIVGVAGLVYLDYQSLTQIDDATINVAYLQGEEYVTGISFPVSVNEELDPSQVETLSLNEYESELDSSPDNRFTISVDESVFSIIEDETISLNELLSQQGAGDILDQELELEASKVIEIINSQNPKEELTDTLLESLNISSTLEATAKPLMISSIEELENSQNLDVQSIALSLLLNELMQKESNIVAVVMEYQDGNIDIHPNKLSFTLLKYVPISIIRDSIVNSLGAENSTIEN